MVSPGEKLRVAIENLEIKDLDLKDHLDGSYLDILTEDLKPIEDRVTLVKRIGTEIFGSDDLDEERVGKFLSAINSLYEKPDTDTSLKREIFSAISPEILKRIAFESAQKRWSRENAEASLHSYKNFMTIDRLFGEDKGHEMKRKMAQDIVFGLAFDRQLNAATRSIALDRQTISLDAEGAIVAQCATKLAWEQAADDLNVKEHIFPYYRERIGVMGDSRRGKMTPEQIAAEFLRRGEVPRGTGVDLALFGGNLDEDGDMRIGPGVADVGEQLGAGTGFALQLLHEALLREEIRFEKPQRTDAVRNLKVKNPMDFVVIGMGDGAASEIEIYLNIAENFRLPAIFHIQNNKVAIGTNLSEVTANTNLWQRGHGVGVPGVRVKMDDADAMVTTAYWAAMRASLHAGSTVLETMTDRPVAHSSQHPNQLTVEKMRQVQEILGTIAANYKSSEDIDIFLRDKLIGTTAENTTYLLKARVLEFLKNTDLPEEIVQKLLFLFSEINDPIESVLARYLQDEAFAEIELSEWRSSAEQSAVSIVRKTNEGIRPDPAIISKFTREETPTIVSLKKGARPAMQFSDEPLKINVEPSSEEIEISGAEAESTALIEAMLENPALCYAGVDVNIGDDIVGKVLRALNKSGYFHQGDGVWDKLGHLPLRIRNMLINERVIASLGLGETIQPVWKILEDEKIAKAIIEGKLDPAIVDPLSRAKRLFINLQYGDYAIAVWNALRVLAVKYERTSGKFNCPIGIVMPCKMTGGGGGQHSNSVEAPAYYLPENVDVFTVSDTETYYKLLRYQLRFGQNPYVIVLNRGIYNLSEKTKFSIDTGFFQPGQDIMHEKGGEAQIVTWGPMAPLAIQTARKVAEQNGKKIGIYEKVSWRPRKKDQIIEFLQSGKGPLFIITEEFQSRSLAGELTRLIETDPDIRRVCHERDRTIHLIASKDASQPFCDEILMNAQKAGSDRISETLLTYLNDGYEALVSLEKTRQKYLFDDDKNTGVLFAKQAVQRSFL